MRGRLTIAAFSGVADRHFDDVDAEERGVRILVVRDAALELLAGAHAAGALTVDVDVRLVLRIGDERMRVRAAAGLNRGDLLGLGEVGDVENANAAESLGADRRLNTLGAAIDSAARLFDRHEQQVAVDRDVALPARTHDRGEQPRPPRILDVIGVEAVEVAEEHVRAAEGEIGVREIETAPAATCRRARSRRGRRRVAGGVAGAPTAAGGVASAD